nr:hypothetical protein [Tanacetum cinerariifolium]
GGPAGHDDARDTGAGRVHGVARAHRVVAGAAEGDKRGPRQVGTSDSKARAHWSAGRREAGDDGRGRLVEAHARRVAAIVGREQVQVAVPVHVAH